MNELIERLAREVELGHLYVNNANVQMLEAFAKAVAKECAEIADQADGEKDCWLVAGKIRERFGLD